MQQTLKFTEELSLIDFQPENLEPIERMSGNGFSCVAVSCNN